jgi:hypothetical protein
MEYKIDPKPRFYADTSLLPYKNTSQNQGKYFLVIPKPFPHGKRFHTSSQNPRNQFHRKTNFHRTRDTEREREKMRFLSFYL